MDNPGNNFMTCPNCKNQIPYGSICCNVCGYSFQYQQQSQQPYQQQVQQPYQQQVQQPYQPQMQQPYQQSYVQPNSNNHYIGMIIGIIAEIMLIISVFLPYVSASAFGVKYSESLFGEDKDGIIFIGLAVVCLIFTFFRKWIVQLILSIVLIVLFFLENSTIDDADTYGLLKRDVGFYLLLVACVCVLISSLVMWCEKSKSGK